MAESFAANIALVGFFIIMCALMFLTRAILCKLLFAMLALTKEVSNQMLTKRKVFHPCGCVYVLSKTSYRRTSAYKLYIGTTICRCSSNSMINNNVN